MTAKWVDDRTLDDMAVTDAEMLQRCYKKADSFDFKSVAEATHFLGACVQATLNKCGVVVTPITKPERVDELMAKNAVRIEHRLDYSKEETWKKGIYIYKNDELIVFISHPQWVGDKLRSYRGSIVSPQATPIKVWTNAKVVASSLII